MYYFSYFCSIFWGFAMCMVLGLTLDAPLSPLHLITGISPEPVSSLIWAIAGIFGWQIFTTTKPDADERALYLKTKKSIEAQHSSTN